jgi:hypothetical protein
MVERSLKGGLMISGGDFNKIKIHKKHKSKGRTYKAKPWSRSKKRRYQF